MSALRTPGCSRREFLARSSALGAAILGVPGVASAEPPPETSKIRLYHAPTICLAPQYVAEELLRAEGFTDVEYTTPEGTATIADEMAEGRIDIGQKTAAYVVPVLDAGVPIVVLAGVHAGCYELFGNDKVREVRDLRGKSVAISAFGSFRTHLRVQHGRLRRHRPGQRDQLGLRQDAAGHDGDLRARGKPTLSLRSLRSRRTSERGRSGT